MEYFPNLTPFKMRSIKRPLLEPALNELATTIPEEKLAQLIQEAVAKQKLQDPYWLQIIDTVGFRPVYDLYEGYDTSNPLKRKLTEEDKINAMLALTTFIGPHEFIAKLGMTGTKTVTRIIMNFPKMIREIAVLKNSLQKGEAVSLKAVGQRAEEWVYKPTYPQSASQIIKARVDQTFRSLMEAYPEGNFEVFSTEGSSAVIYVDKYDPRYVYKVYIKKESGLPGDPAERWISSVRYAEEEARKLKVLSEQGIAPELIEYTPPRLSADQKRLVSDPNYGFHYEGYKDTEHVSIPVANRSSDVPIIKMERVDVDVNGLENITPEELQRQVDNIVSVLERLEFYPGDTEPVVNQNGKLLFIDLGGMIPVRKGSPFEHDSIREAVESHFSRRLPAARGGAQISPGTLDNSDIPLERNLLPGFLVRRGQDRFVFWQGLRELHRQGRVAVIDRRTALDMINDYIVHVENYFRNNGRNLSLNRNSIQRIAEEGRIIVETQEIIEAYSGLRYVRGLASIFTAEPNSSYIMLSADVSSDLMRRYVFPHELTHHLVNLSSREGISSGFSYNPTQADIYGKIMSEWIELGADLIAEKVFGAGPGHYPGFFTKRYAAMTELKNRINARYGVGLSDLDFMEFAMTGKDSVLMDKIRTKMSPEEFLDVVENTINTADLQRMYEIWTRSLDNRKVYAEVNGKFDWVQAREVLLVSAAATGGIIETAFMADFITKVSQGMSLPPNLEIISVTPPGSEDMDLLKKQEIVINQVQGLSYPGSTIKVSVFITENGQLINADSPGLSQASVQLSLSTEEGKKPPFTIHLLTDKEKCKNSCQAILPANLEPGSYFINADLIGGKLNQILAGDHYLITVLSKTTSSSAQDDIIDQPEYSSQTIGDMVKLPGLTVTGMTVGNNKHEVSGGMEEVVSSLTLTEGTNSIPITIKYSDGSVDYLGYTFNYHPKDKTEKPSADEWVKDPYGECNWDERKVYDIEVSKQTGERRRVTGSGHYVKGECDYQGEEEVQQTSGTADCPSSYPQCGGTAGLEDYPRTDTVRVTPVCDNNGSITDYKKENLGNKGECL